MCHASVVKSMILSKRNLPCKWNPTQLKAANQLPVDTRGIVRLPVKIGGIKFEHKFHALAKFAAECFIGLDFLEDHQCDLLF